MGALMRAHDWRSSPLGDPADWPAALRTALGVILNTGHPMYIWWGPELLCFYNDAYRQSIGPERHPGSLGSPGREVWDEVWDIIGPQIHQVMSGRGATWQENALVPITRNGRREEVYWTYSYSPIVDPSSPSGVGGVLVVCAETTAHIVAARQRGAGARAPCPALRAGTELRRDPARPRASIRAHQSELSALDRTSQRDRSHGCGGVAGCRGPGLHRVARSGLLRAGSRTLRTAPSTRCSSRPPIPSTSATSTLSISPSKTLTARSTGFSSRASMSRAAR